MRISLLTGAGAGVPLGLPIMLHLYQNGVVQNLHQHESWVLEIAKNWSLERRPGTLVDFEHLLTAVYLIGKMDNDTPLSIAFARAVHGVGLMMSPSSGAAGAHFSRVHAVDAAQKLQTKLEGVVHKQLADVNPVKSAELYLPVLELMHQFAPQAPSMRMFTTNYDLAIETLWQTNQHKNLNFNTDLQTGFSPIQYQGIVWDDTNFQDAPTGKTAVQLFKLHGSLNWTRKAGLVVQSEHPDHLGRGRHAVLYPISKADLEEPFHTLLEEFDRDLTSVDVLVVIGSSLRDEHLRDAINKALAKRSALRLVVLDEAAHEVRKNLAESHRSRVIPINARFGEGNWFVTLSSTLSSIEQQLSSSSKLADLSNPST